MFFLLSLELFSTPTFRLSNIIKALSTTQRGKDIERGKGGGHCRCVSYCMGGGASPKAGKKSGLFTILVHTITPPKTSYIHVHIAL
jgi:hypothetical protein